MYIPKLFEVTDLATLHEFIETHSFATLVTAAGEPQLAPRAKRVTAENERVSERAAMAGGLPPDRSACKRGRSPSGRGGGQGFFTAT